jgi:hypothetical protein
LFRFCCRREDRFSQFDTRSFNASAKLHHRDAGWGAAPVVVPGALVAVFVS